jgi:chromosome segregation ATPase
MTEEEWTVEREELLGKIRELSARVSELEDEVASAEEDAEGSSDRESSMREALTEADELLDQLRTAPLDQVDLKIEAIQETVRGPL